MADGAATSASIMGSVAVATIINMLVNPNLFKTLYGSKFVIDEQEGLKRVNIENSHILGFRKYNFLTVRKYNYD